jgi:hypothetical protein
VLCDYCCPAAAAQACQVECPGGAVVVRLAPEDTLQSSVPSEVTVLQGCKQAFAQIFCNRGCSASIEGAVACMPTPGVCKCS